MNARLSIIFLTGVAIGTALGLLIAPEPACATLRMVKQDADRLVDKVERLKASDGIAAKFSMWSLFGSKLSTGLLNAALIVLPKLYELK